MTQEKMIPIRPSTRNRPFFDVSVRHQSAGALVVLAGELDMASAPILAGQMVSVLDVVKGDLVLDIGLLTFIDSSGLSEFISLHDELRSRGANLVIVSVTPMVCRLFRITGLMDVLTIRPV